jgi:MFS family permease
MSPTAVPAPPKLSASLSIALVLLAISVFINYIDRGSLSIAAPMLKDEMGISAAKLGLLLSAFFWTYAGMMLLSGWLVDRLKVNWVFAAGFLLWSIATAATGLARTFAALFIVRLLLGAGESVAYPSYSRIIATNFPEIHRGRANAVISAGLTLGPGFGIVFGSLLMAQFGWRTCFVVLGLASLLWLIPWLKWMPRNPLPDVAESPRAKNIFEFFRVRSFWGTCLGLFGGNYINYFLITWLPFYLVRERGFTLEKMARVGGTAYLLGACSSLIAGWLSDRWIKSGASPTLVRKTFVGGGGGLAGMFLGLVGFSSPTYCVPALILALIFFGAAAANVWAITQRLAGPLCAGRWTGLQCCIGNLAGIVAPAVTGLVVQRTGHFYWAFAIMMGVELAAVTCWIFVVGPVEQVNWRLAPGTPAALAPEM